MSRRRQTLRALVNERLTAAAEEIFALVERTIAEYEEELCRCKLEKQRKQQLLESFTSPQVHSTEETRSREETRAVEENHTSDTTADEAGLILKQEVLSDPQSPEAVEVQVKKEFQEELAITAPSEHTAVATETHWANTAVAMETQTEKRTESPTSKHVYFPNINTASPTATGETLKNWTVNTDMEIEGATPMDQSHSVSRLSVISPQKNKEKTKAKTLYPWIKSLCCPFCSRMFTTENNLKLHVMLHTGEQPYQCSMCEKGFRTKGLLNTHIKMSHSELIMPKVLVRDTEWSTYLEILRKAAEQHEKRGISVRKAAANFGLSNSTLQRFLKQNAEGRANFGYQNCNTGLVFASDMEKLLADHVRELENVFHGLTAKKCKKLAYEFARLNNLDKTPKGWEEKKMAGEDWFEGFKKRHNLKCGKPETTSLAKSMAFNKTTVGNFFGKLKEVYDRHNFKPGDIYCLDETEFTTVQRSTTSMERGQLVTAVFAINAAGKALPPFYAFPCLQMEPDLLSGAFPGSAGAASPSGWTTEMFSEHFLPFFIAHSHCSPEFPVLLILDNHESHVSLRALTLAKASGIVLLTLPPYTSHRLQPLERTVFAPMRTSFKRAIEALTRLNSGRTIFIDELASLTCQAYCSAMTSSNILTGFKSTGIYPLNPDVFTEHDFQPALVGDRGAHYADRATCVEHRAAGVTDRAAGVGDRTVIVADRAAGFGEGAVDITDKAAGVADRTTADADRTTAVAIRAAGVADRAAHAVDRAAGVGDRTVNVADRVVCVGDRQAGVADRAAGVADVPSMSSETRHPNHFVHLPQFVFPSALNESLIPPTNSAEVDINAYNNFFYYNSLLE